MTHLFQSVCPGKMNLTTLFPKFLLEKLLKLPFPMAHISFQICLMA